jgi:hypothetical protein
MEAAPIEEESCGASTGDRPEAEQPAPAPTGDDTERQVGLIQADAPAFVHVTAA